MSRCSVCELVLLVRNVIDHMCVSMTVDSVSRSREHASKFPSRSREGANNLPCRIRRRVHFPHVDLRVIPKLELLHRARSR